MMAEMLAGLLAITLAMGSVTAIAQLSASSQRTQAAAATRLSADRQVQRVLRTAAGEATPPSRPETTLTVGPRLTLACGAAGVSLCELAVGERDTESLLILTVDGREVASSPLDHGGFRLLAVVEGYGQGHIARLAGPLSLVDPQNELRAVATVDPHRRIDAGCRFDPVSSVCSGGGR